MYEKVAIQTFLLKNSERTIEAYAAQLPLGSVYVQHLTGTQKLERYRDLMTFIRAYAGENITYTAFDLDRFHLQREEDVSGVSGIGTVAHGVLFPNNLVVQEWAVEPYGIGIYQSLDDMLHAHGHNGKTIPVFY